MENEKKLKTVQMFYAAALADCVLRLGNEGVLEKVEKEKRIEQLEGGKTKALQMGIETPKQVFKVIPDIFNCANWHVEDTSDGLKATATSCTLCAMAKKIGAKSPCNIYCIDVMEGMVKGLDKNAKYEVLSTLWDNNECKISVKTEK